MRMVMVMGVEIGVGVTGFVSAENTFYTFELPFILTTD